MSNKINMLFVGAPPPPYHGQAVITGLVFETKFVNIIPTFYEARFSEELSSVGGTSFKKFIVLIKTWWKMLTYVLMHKDAELYYCAGSAHTIPFLKDLVLLGSVGKLFSKKYIHYHSGGVPKWLEENKLRSVLGNYTYDRDSVSVACSRFVAVPSGDGGVQELPNGLEVPYLSKSERPDDKLHFLYVGALRETKGVKILLDAAQKLSGNYFDLSIVGEWVSPEERAECLSNVSETFLEEHVRFLGLLTGEDKWTAFRAADVFVFPTFYESENMPLVIIESLGSGLPVISTEWRSIPKLVQDGETGMLVAPQDVQMLADRMLWSMCNREELIGMGHKARLSYEEQYSVDAFQNRLRVILGDTI